MIKKYLEGWVQLFGDRPNFPRFLLQHGRDWTVTPDTYKGRRYKKKACFRNATILAERGKGTYVEGYATSVLGIPIEHAWVVDAEGRVIDPTWNPRNIEGTAEYFGVPFNLETLEKSMLETGFYGMFGFPANLRLFDMTPGEFMPEQFRPV